MLQVLRPGFAGLLLWCKPSSIYRVADISFVLYWCCAKQGLWCMAGFLHKTVTDINSNYNRGNLSK